MSYDRSKVGSQADCLSWLRLASKMGFIAQTFGNTFRTSNGHSDTQQSYSSTRKFHSKPAPKDYHYTRVVSAAPQLHLSEGGVHKKRRHVGPDNSVAVTSSVLERPSYCSSVGSDEPLILPASKGKGKSTSGAMQDSNRNQSAYANGLSSPSYSRLQARPPTTNWLDTHERSELVRRSRKLGSILGETPRLLDVEEDDHSTTEALDKLEGRQIGRAKSRIVVASERPTFRRSLTLDADSVGPNLSPSRSSPASRHSFLLNDENSSGTPRSPHHRSGPGPRFGRTRSTARHAPLLRLSTTSVSENTPSYLGRRHSLDVSARKGVSLNAVDMNVGFESGSDISAPKAPSFDTSSLGSSTMPTFARPQSPCSLLDNASLSSRVSLNDSMANVSLGVPGQYATELSLPPSPTTPLTPILTQAEDARRKMRKLARHLGESVPADLVLGTAGARRAAHDHLTEDAAPQFLQVPASGRPLAKSKANSGVSVPFSLGKPPSGHRKTQSVWKGTNGERGAAAPSRRIVRRASSAGQLRIETPTSSPMTAEEKARNVRRAMKMLQVCLSSPSKPNFSWLATLDVRRTTSS